MEARPALKPEQQQVFEKLCIELPEIMKSQFPDVPDHDHYTNAGAIGRFAAAHEYKTEAVIAKWKAWIQWRSTYKPHEISETEETIEKQNESGKLKWYKYDKEKRPCLYYRMRFHTLGLATPDETVRYFIYMLEKGLKEAEKLGQTKIVVVYDRRGYDKSNQDPKSIDAGKQLTPILQDYYPERLHCFYVIGANWFYRMMFGIVKAFVSKKTLEKISILGSTEDLLDNFNKEDLLIEYGGVTEGDQKFAEKVKKSKRNGADDGDESEDETELRKLADNIYKSHGVEPPKLSDAM